MRNLVIARFFGGGQGNLSSISGITPAKRNCKSGFTLAEVLITLGIIGIVAAMTLPNITAKYRNRVLKSRFNKNYSILSQALALTSAELGQGLHVMFENEQPGWDGAVVFRNTFYKYLKHLTAGGIKFSHLNGNFSSYNPNQTNAAPTMGLGAFPGYKILADGTAVSVLKNNGNLNVLVDINGREKPNRVGYDVFLFIVDAKQDKLVSWSTDKVYCSKTSTKSYNGRACTYYALIDVCPDNPEKGYWEGLDY